MGNHTTKTENKSPDYESSPIKEEEAKKSLPERRKKVRHTKILSISYVDENYSVDRTEIMINDPQDGWSSSCGMKTSSSGSSLSGSSSNNNRDIGNIRAVMTLYHRGDVTNKYKAGEYVDIVYSHVVNIIDEGTSPWILDIKKHNRYSKHASNI